MGSIKAEINYSGLIRSLELTYGVNGWHPHTHELWFVGKSMDAEEIKEYVIDKWWSSCVKAGLVEDNKNEMLNFYKHAVDIKGNCSASDYLAKQDSSKNWGVDREVAKATSNKVKSRVYTHSLLTDEYKNINLWLEFSKAIKEKKSVVLVQRTKEKMWYRGNF